MGAWPASWRRQGSGGGARAAVPQLQPVNGALAAWALNAYADPLTQTSFPDRSGNNNVASNQRATGTKDCWLPSRRSPARAPWFTGLEVGAGYLLCDTLLTPAFLAAPWTATMWLTWAGPVGPLSPSSSEIDFMVQASVLSPVNRYFCYWTPTVPRLSAYCSGGPGAAVSSLLVPHGVWGFVSVRSFGNGQVRFGRDGAYETVDMGTTATSTSKLTIGASGYGAGSIYPFGGGIEDMLFWAGAQTDAFIDAQEAYARGLS